MDDPRVLRATQQLATPTPEVAMDPEILEALREALPEVADHAVSAIIDEVPSYANALSGQMGETIRNVVVLALGGFLTLSGRNDAPSPMTPALEGSYQIGRGEARSGRSMEALLAAFRVGARVCWRDMAKVAVEHRVASDQLAHFAELVFHYIDRLSEAAALGHADELESSGRVRLRNLERLTRALLTRAAPDAIVAAAERADWEPPGALTAVIMPDYQMLFAFSLLDTASLQVPDDVPGVPPGHSVLLVPSTGTPAARRTLVRSLRDTSSVLGHAVPWLEAADSFTRARRCLGLGLEGFVDTDEHLAPLVLEADPRARADL
ncbi:MAG: PucR family transcriptional regulator, partial [Nocardioides sp.]|uniref:PucR family transcriptional regulator n=1 Tax=Nocardioides sp. TaxID=35761 RepID=UPI003EFEE1A0